MIGKTKSAILKIVDKRNKKPLLVLHIYKRHVLLILIIIVSIILLYGVYFRFYMTLPQSAINVVPELPLSLSNQRILVLAPHCDDETLGAGGLIQRSIKENSQLDIVITTDCNYRKNGVTRKDETKKALKVFGLDSSDIIFLNFPEQEETENNPKYISLGEAISKEIDQFKPTIIVSPHPEDSHIDHRNVGKIVDNIDSNTSSYAVIYYLIHSNFMKYPSPSGYHPADYLLPPARLINFSDRWYKLDLNEEEEDNKEVAVYEYKTQLRRTNPILYRILLDFIRRNELFMMKNN